MRTTRLPLLPSSSAGSGLRFVLLLVGCCVCSLPGIVDGSGPAVAEESDAPALPFHAQGEKSGDPTQDSVILLTRLTAVADGKLHHDVPGMAGRVRFEIAADADFENSRLTDWADANERNDHTIKQTVTGLAAGTKYWYRAIIAAPAGDARRIGPPRTFVTAPSSDMVRDVRFCVITGQGYATRDSDRGHHAYLAMEKLEPDFLALTGDTIYYDGMAGGVPKHVLPPEADGNVRAWMRQLARMPADDAVFWLRKHWHAMYAFPIQREFHGKIPGYWQVDDHDYYKNDWSGGYWEPGSIVFREQNPIPEKTYRTVRWGKHLQIWLVEGRELRDLDAQPPTIWGREQFDWLVDSLAESDATFKVLISPTPVVGSGQKSHPDNHGCPPFLEERQAFFDAITKRKVKNFYVVCGDKHRKHHSRDKATQVHEFCCGALSPKHGGNFWPPVDESGLLELLHEENPKELGGFLMVDIRVEDGPPKIVFTHHDAQGNRQAQTRFDVE